MRDHNGGSLDDIAQETRQRRGVELAGERQWWALGHAKAEPVGRVNMVALREAREDAAILIARRAGVEVVREDNRERVLWPGDGIVEVAAVLAVHLRVAIKSAA
jgi:hypothetical protein